jgi:hypothetical protein
MPQVGYFHAAFQKGHIWKSLGYPKCHSGNSRTLMVLCAIAFWRGIEPEGWTPGTLFTDNAVLAPDTRPSTAHAPRLA